MTAIGDGRFADATQMANLAATQGSAAGQTALITSDEVALGIALEDPQVVSQKSFGDSGLVQVSVKYTFDGAPVSGTVTLEPAGTEFGVLTRWQVVDASFLGTLSIEAPGSSSVSVNDIEFGLASGQSTASVFAYPGEYAVAAKSTAFIDFAPGTLSAPQGSGTSALTEDFSAAFWRQLQDKVDAAIDRCLEVLSSCYAVSNVQESSSECWNPTYSSSVRNVIVGVDEYPTFAVRYFLSAGVIDGTIELESAGAASFSFESERFAYPESTWIGCTATADFSNLYVNWSISGDELRIDPL